MVHFAQSSVAMRIDELPQDIIHVIATSIPSAYDLTSLNVTCRQIYQYTGKELERRKFVLLYSEIIIDEELIYDFHLKHLGGHDWRAARYIREILDEPRIGYYVKVLKIKENLALRVLRNSLSSTFLQFSSPYRIPSNVSDFIIKTIDSFPFIEDETKVTWKREALQGHVSPLCMVLFTLCQRVEALDLSHASVKLIPYLLPLLGSFTIQRRFPQDIWALEISTFPLPPIVELRIAKISFRQLAMFFEIPTVCKVEGSSIDEGVETQLDHDYLADVGSRSKIEEIVLVQSSIREETLAELINAMSKLERLQLKMSTTRQPPGQNEDVVNLNAVALQRVGKLMRTFSSLAWEVLKSRQLEIGWQLMERNETLKWNFTVAKASHREEVEKIDL